MIHAIQSRINRDERGFTLIELMVVVLIIAILIAIAIPTFLGARSRAQDRAAQSDLRNALLAAEVHYTDGETYDIANATTLSDIEPELSFVVGNPVADTTDVYVTYDDAANIVFVRESASGTAFCIRKNETAGTFYGSGVVGDTWNAAAPANCGDASW